MDHAMPTGFVLSAHAMVVRWHGQLAIAPQKGLPMPSEDYKALTLRL
jgi:hypothetical protein